MKKLNLMLPKAMAPNSQLQPTNRGKIAIAAPDKERTVTNTMMSSAGTKAKERIRV